MDTLQAAILLEKLEIFPQEVTKRNHIAHRYSKHLEGFVEIPFVPPGYMSVWAQYSIQSGKREYIQTALKQSGIPTSVYYPKPLHLQNAFKYLGYKEGDFPISENISQQIFSLPMHPYLKDEQVDRIADIIKKT